MPDQHQTPNDPAPTPHSRPPRWQRFRTTRYWLVLKNVVGWPLILLSFVAGPLIPGPGGIPLFLLGFALVSFPGKRRLTARVLRGRPVQFRRGLILSVGFAVASILAAVALAVGRTRSDWISRAIKREPLAAVVLYLLPLAVIWAMAGLAPAAVNLLMRIVARGGDFDRGCGGTAFGYSRRGGGYAVAMSRAADHSA